MFYVNTFEEFFFSILPSAFVASLLGRKHVGALEDVLNVCNLKKSFYRVAGLISIFCTTAVNDKSDS